MRKAKKYWTITRNPRNVGSFAKDAVDVGTGMVGAPACGDVMKLQIKVGPDGIIEDAKFKTYGCGSAIASSSLVTEWVRRQDASTRAMTIRQHARSRKSWRCRPVKNPTASILAEDAIKAAVADYRSRKHGSGLPRKAIGTEQRGRQARGQTDPASSRTESD